MKKLILVFTTAFLCSEFKAQSFHKGALVTDLRGGIEVYNIEADITHKNGSTSRDTTQTDKAGDTHFGLSAEYGLHKYVGAGIGFNRHNFLSEKDSVTGTKDKTNSTDIFALINFHPVSTKKFDLVIGTDIGYSMFKLNSNDSANLVVKGKGLYMSWYLNPRIYFGNFGINFRLFSPYFSYKNLTTNNADFNKNFTYNRLKGAAAWGISFGIQYRFLSKKDDKEEKKN